MRAHWDCARQKAHIGLGLQHTPGPPVVPATPGKTAKLGSVVIGSELNGRWHGEPPSPALNHAKLPKKIPSESKPTADGITADHYGVICRAEPIALKLLPSVQS